MTDQHDLADELQLRVAIARDLSAIDRLYALLPAEAEAQALGRDAGRLDAMNLLGPAANVEAWQNRWETAVRVARERGALAGGDRAEEIEGERAGAYVNDQTAELHPLLVLATWEDLIREEREQPSDLPATVQSAGAYLRRSLDWMFSLDDDGRPVFLGVDAFARDLRGCRRVLEDVTSEGFRPELSRVWCTAVGQHGEHERIRLHFRAGAVESLDRWVCPRCEARYDYSEYISAMRINLHAEAADRFVLVATAKQAVGAPEQTMRSWMRRLVVAAVCDLRTHRLMVWWPDVREAEAERQRIKRSRRAG